MGKIKTKNYKTYVSKFLDEVPIEKAINFEEAKVLVHQYLENPISKTMRNKLAGYLVRRIKKNF